MKTWIPALFALVLPSAVFADGEAPLKFRKVAEFLAWADKKLAADDHDALAAAQTDTSDSQQTKIESIKALDASLGEKKLATIFKGREFPKDAAIFKLGGHGKELGHCHIDFEKNGDSWRIARIWDCR
jgi:hypothetical protein